jgi:hypothetical protein
MVFVVLTLYGKVLGVFKDRSMAEQCLKTWLIKILPEFRTFHEDFITTMKRSSTFTELPIKVKIAYKNIDDFFNHTITKSQLNIFDVKLYIFSIVTYIAKGDEILNVDDLISEQDVIDIKDEDTGAATQKDDKAARFQTFAETQT